ncbi:MAG: hypothetical protein MHM6MM_006590, partial [Cercozoa sp. M6MM]
MRFLALLCVLAFVRAQQQFLQSCTADLSDPYSTVAYSVDVATLTFSGGAWSQKLFDVGSTKCTDASVPSTLRIRTLSVDLASYETAAATPPWTCDDSEGPPVFDCVEVGHMNVGAWSALWWQGPLLFARAMRVVQPGVVVSSQSELITAANMRSGQPLVARGTSILFDASRDASGASVAVNAASDALQLPVPTVFEHFAEVLQLRALSGTHLQADVTTSFANSLHVCADSIHHIGQIDGSYVMDCPHGTSETVAASDTARVHTATNVSVRADAVLHLLTAKPRLLVSDPEGAVRVHLTGATTSLSSTLSEALLEHQQLHFYQGLMDPASSVRTVLPAVQYSSSVQDTLNFTSVTVGATQTYCDSLFANNATAAVFVTTGDGNYTLESTVSSLSTSGNQVSAATRCDRIQYHILKDTGVRVMEVPNQERPAPALVVLHSRNPFVLLDGINGGWRPVLKPAVSAQRLDVLLEYTKPRNIYDMSFLH